MLAHSVKLISSGSLIHHIFIHTFDRYKITYMTICSG